MYTNHPVVIRIFIIQYYSIAQFDIEATHLKACTTAIGHVSYDMQF